MAIPRAGRMTYEPELPDDDYLRWLKQQEQNTADELTKAAYWAAQHTYRVLVRRQQPHFIEEPDLEADAEQLKEMKLLGFDMLSEEET